MQNYEENEIINIFTDEELTVKDITLLIKKIVGFEGELIFDASRSGGTLGN